MNTGYKNIFVAMLIISISQFSHADNSSENKQAYLKQLNSNVHRFASQNRFNIGNINRDKYSNCYLEVGLEMTINKNGVIKDVYIKEPSPVPKVNKYFSYVLQNTRPLIPLAKYFGNNVNEVVLFERYRLNLSEYRQFDKPCSQVKNRTLDVNEATFRCEKNNLEAYHSDPDLFATKNGKWSLKEVAFVIDCKRKDIYRTFSKYLKTDKELGGRLIVQFTIEPNGLISHAKAAETSISNPNFVNDILKLVASMKFVKKDLKPQVIIYPFEFSPN